MYLSFTPFTFSCLTLLSIMSNQVPNQHQLPPGQPEDPESSKSVSLETDGLPVLQVIDARYDGTAPTAHHMFSSSDNIAQSLRDLPPHKKETARIFDVTVRSDFVITGLRDTKGPKTTQSARDDLINYLQATYTVPFQERQIFRWLTDPLLVNDIGSISSQWSQHLSRGSSRLYRLVNRTSLQQHPLDYDVRPRDSHLTCAQDSDIRLIGECISSSRMLLLLTILQLS